MEDWHTYYEIDRENCSGLEITDDAMIDERVWQVYQKKLNTLNQAETILNRAIYNGKCNYAER